MSLWAVGTLLLGAQDEAERDAVEAGGDAGPLPVPVQDTGKVKERKGKRWTWPNRRTKNLNFFFFFFLLRVVCMFCRHSYHTVHGTRFPGGVAS